MSCLKEAIQETQSRDNFHCPLCVERGWHIQPPPEILPLTPSPSREGSPVPSINEDTPRPQSGPRDGQVQSLQKDRPSASDVNQVVRDLNSSGEILGNESQVTIQDQGQSTRSTSSDHNASLCAERSILRNSSVTARARLHHLHENSDVLHSDNANESSTSRTSKKRSRYQTMPDELDQAIATIYRELESVAKLRLEIKLLQGQVKAADQTRQITEGDLALERSRQKEALAQKDAEINSLKQQFSQITRNYDSLMKENCLLKQHAQEEESSTQAKLEEMQSLKARLRQWLDV